MKLLKYFLIFCFVWFNLTPQIFANSDRIVFGVNPWQNPKEMYDMFNPLIQYIGKQLKKKAILIVVKDYEDLSNKIQSQLIDVGDFSPNAYVEAKEKIPSLRYIATGKTVHKNPNVKMRDHYKSVIIVSKNSPFHTLKDLKGKRFAFTSKKSTSGYIFPNYILKERGFDPQTYFSELFWLKKHSRITSAIVKNSIDAGATFDNHIARETTKYGNVFRIIVESPPIPNGAFAAGPHVSDEICKEIQDILIRLTPESSALQATHQGSVGIGGYTIRSDQFYDIIRKVKNNN